MRIARLFYTGRKARRSHPSSSFRRVAFEPLEHRQLLDGIGLNPIADVTLAAGSTMYVPLQGSDAGSTIHYSITSADYAKLTPVMMPSTNKSVQMNVNINGVDQPMTFQLFDNLAPITAAHIEKLVNEGFYNGLQIYRNGKDGSVANNPFVIQGGNIPPSGQIKTPTADAGNIAEEFNPNLQYTSSGAFAMARTSTPGTSSTEFFVGEGNYRFLDYNYSLFGFQTTGQDVIKTIAAMANSPLNSSLGYLQTPLTITSASLFTDTHNGLLQLTAPTGVTGAVQVTVTASDGTNAPMTQTFSVSIEPDSVVNPNSASPANPWASSFPSAPTSVTFLPPAGGQSQTTSLDNASSLSTLDFLVSGVTAGNKVEILADGNVIGTATATTTSVTVTTDGHTPLAAGPHTITALQILPSETVTVAESGATSGVSSTADVQGYSSLATSLAVVSPFQITSTPAVSATVGEMYSYTVTTDLPESDPAVRIICLAGPMGINDDGSGTFTWTPSIDQAGTQQTLTIAVTDSNGATVTQTVTVDVATVDMQITSTPPSSAVAGLPYVYQLTTDAPAFDPLLSVTAVTKPAGMRQDGHGGFTWTPTLRQAGGSQTLVIRAVDEAQNVRWQTVTISVTAVSLQITSAPSAFAVAGQTYVYQVTTNAPDFDPITRIATLDRPAGMSDDGQGNLVWTPTDDDAGTTRRLMVVVNDLAHNVRTQYATIKVLKSMPATPIVQALGRQTGLPGGGNTVSIRGKNLAAATEVYFGTTRAKILSASDKVLCVLTPAGTGTVDVTVVTPGGKSAKIKADRFTYLPPPGQTTPAASTTDKLRLSVVDQLMRLV